MYFVGPINRPNLTKAVEIGKLMECPLTFCGDFPGCEGIIDDDVNDFS